MSINGDQSVASRERKRPECSETQNSGRLRSRLASTNGLLTRRDFSQRVAGGFFGAALAYLVGAERQRAAAQPPSDLRPRAPHFPARATSVIHLFMNGGPSQMDL